MAGTSSDQPCAASGYAPCRAIDILRPRLQLPELESPVYAGASSGLSGYITRPASQPGRFQEDSNLYFELRRLASYPLDDGNIGSPLWNRTTAWLGCDPFHGSARAAPLAGDSFLELLVDEITHPAPDLIRDEDERCRNDRHHHRDEQSLEHLIPPMDGRGRP